MSDVEEINQKTNKRPVWSFKTPASLDKGLFVIADRKSTVAMKERSISRLLKTDKELLQLAIEQLVDIFEQAPISLRHNWLDYFEEMITMGVCFDKVLPRISRFLHDKNYHFREMVGSFLMRRGYSIAVCYKDINWCLAQSGEDYQNLGLRLAQVLGDRIEQTTKKFVDKIANGKAANDALAQKAREFSLDEHQQDNSVEQSSTSKPLAQNITCHPIANKRVLLITQYKTMQLLLKKILLHFDAFVTVANDPSDALRIVRRARDAGENIDIIIVDMPEPVASLRHLRQEKGRETQKILVLSKAIESDKLKLIAQQKVDCILLKPFGIRELTESLAGIAEEKE